MACGSLTIALALNFCVVLALPLHRSPVNDALFSEEVYFAEWQKFVRDFGKSFDSQADQLSRYATFQRNFDFIHSFNRNSTGLLLAVNSFADMTSDEFRRSRLGSFSSAAGRRIASTPNRTSSGDLPDAVDWVAKGAVTGVKDQGNCGSCWAFSTVASVEGAVAVATGRLVALSEQQLMDCDASLVGNRGCGGGEVDAALRYVAAHGLETEAAYPYTAFQDECQASEHGPASPGTVIAGFADVAPSEAALKQAVARQPVSVAIEADKDLFRFYSSGVLGDAAGCGAALDHAVAVVGYGADAQGNKYWKVKNSWGAQWGMAGYVLLARTDADSGPGMCGVALMASAPDLPSA